MNINLTTMLGNLFTNSPSFISHIHQRTSFMTFCRHQVASALCLTLLIVGVVQSARADVIATYIEDGSGVTGSLTGTSTLTSNQGTGTAYADVGPSGNLGFGGTLTTLIQVQVVTGTWDSAPTAAVNPSGYIDPTAVTGDLWYFSGDGGIVNFPVGYVSGAAINSSIFFSGQTLVSLGIASGSRSYTFTKTGGGDSLGLTITAAVPEPSTWMLLASALGIGCRGLLRQRRRTTADPWQPAS
jgi:hypothetical protein